jgi:peptide-methionine (S)-S-oxide reductase
MKLFYYITIMINYKFTRQIVSIVSLFVILIFIGSCTSAKAAGESEQAAEAKAAEAEAAGESRALATFGAGCFWGVEASFEKVDGVASVVSGYAGGTTKDPTYQDVCGGNTGHAEVVQVTYDPAVVTYEKLVEVFWKIHTPTKTSAATMQSTQYRSIILYHNERQKRIAEASKKELADRLDKPVSTHIEPLSRFF